MSTAPKQAGVVEPSGPEKDLPERLPHAHEQTAEQKAAFRAFLARITRRPEDFLGDEHLALLLDGGRLDSALQHALAQREKFNFPWDVAMVQALSSIMVERRALDLLSPGVLEAIQRLDQQIAALQSDRKAMVEKLLADLGVLRAGVQGDAPQDPGA
ncbi:MAG: hypothetical protein IT477_10550 [Rhodanobacteraceae bacterium]|nr:hypothetical protein [Rhodanobacteraceae bacterium]